jgi:hypothetical protein
MSARLQKILAIQFDNKFSFDNGLWVGIGVLARRMTAYPGEYARIVIAMTYLYSVPSVMLTSTK